MSRKSIFNDFLGEIRLTKAQRDDLITGHTTLRDRLESDTNLSSIIVTTFLQGSYRRSTATKPKNNKRADVDIIVVTTLDKDNLTPEEAIKKFIPFVEEHYKGKYIVNGRSIGIELSYVDLDIVITSAPSEVDQTALRSESVTTKFGLEELNNDWKLVKGWIEPDHRNFWSSFTEESVRNSAEWKLDPLWIPDRDAKCWVQTHPLEQIRWTRDKNKLTNGHYVNVVKGIKWWRTTKLTDLKYPKGYPVEHMVGDCCPDNINSVEEGIVRTLEAIVAIYSIDRILERTPTLNDRGVPDHNVWKRVSPEDFVTFYDSVKEAAKTARKAFDADKDSDWHDNWRNLLGDEFPPISSEQARAERLKDKVQALATGQATVGKNVNILYGTSGVAVPRERNHYDTSSSMSSVGAHRSNFDQYVQYQLVKERFPDCKARFIDGVLVIDLEIRDPDLSSIYKAQIIYESTHNHKVYIKSPKVIPSIAVHMYSDGSLCLYYPPDISPLRRIGIALDLIPLTLSWVFLYERWLVNGNIWEGEESPIHWWLIQMAARRN